MLVSRSCQRFVSLVAHCEYVVALFSGATGISGFVPPSIQRVFAIEPELDYVTADGSRSNYIPDFIVKLTNGEVWIVGTKSREDESDPGKWERLQQHCADASNLDAGRQYRALLVREEESDTYSSKHNHTRRHLSEWPRFSDKVGIG